jgi:hypothetical protein
VVELDVVVVDGLVVEPVLEPVEPIPAPVQSFWPS